SCALIAPQPRNAGPRRRSDGQNATSPTTAAAATSAGSVTLTFGCNRTVSAATALTTDQASLITSQAMTIAAPAIAPPAAGVAHRLVGPPSAGTTEPIMQERRERRPRAARQRSCLGEDPTQPLERSPRPRPRQPPDRRDAARRCDARRARRPRQPAAVVDRAE